MPLPFPAWGPSNGSEGNDAALKGVRGRAAHFRWPGTPRLRGRPGCPRKSAPRRSELDRDHYATVSPPDCPVSREEDRGQQCACVHRGGHGQQLRRSPTPLTWPKLTPRPGPVEGRHASSSTGS